jgi:hypothetical protein
MATGAITVNEGTQSNILTDTAGTQEIGVIKIDTSAAGTYGSLWGGNVGVSSGTINAGTVDLIKAGTINSATVVINSATISVLPNLPQGSINVTAGTVNAGTINTGTLNAGTIDLVKAGTITRVEGGSIIITAGSVGGLGGTAAIVTGRPLRIGGRAATSVPGTVGDNQTVDQYYDTVGRLAIWDGQLAFGTVSHIGNLDAGTITVLPNLPQGSINVTAGTIATLGTMGTLGLVNTVTTVSNITNGSIVVTAGTVAAHAITAATITTGTINTGTINLGTMVGKDANAAAQTGNPIAIGGTDSGGTIRTVLVNSAGAMSVSGASSGTFVNLTTGTLNAGTINAATINTGSIVVTNGTVIGNGGSMIAYGPVAAAVAAAGNPLNVGGTDSGGTIRTIKVDSGGLQRIGLDSGTITVLPNLPQGSINVTAGTVTSGSIVVIAGTQNVGTMNAGTINTGTINAGTFTMTTGTINAGTLKDNLAAVGTFTITVGTLASSTAGVGRQSTLVDNTSNLFGGAMVYAQITVGSVTTANQLISFYLIRSDNGAPIADDGAGASDAAWTQKNAPLLGNMLIPTVGTAVQYMQSFDTAGLGHLGPKWGVGVVQSTGNNLHTTLGSHSITYVAYNARF